MRTGHALIAIAVLVAMIVAGSTAHAQEWAWANLRTAGTSDLRSVSLLDDQFAVISGSNASVLQFDGLTLTSVPGAADAFTSGSNLGNLFATAVVAPDDVWIGSYTTPTGVQHWNGEAWSGNQSSNVTASLWAASTDLVLAGRNGGRVSLYDGTGWSHVLNTSAGVFHGIHGSGLDNIWAVGNGGQIYSSINAGQAGSWTQIASPVADQVWQSVSTLNSAATWVVGNNGQIAYWNGTSFSTQDSGVTQNLRGVHAFAADDVYAVGDAGTILHFDGAAWSPVDLGFTYAIKDDLRGIGASPTGSLMVVGDRDRVLFYGPERQRPEDFGKQWVRSHDFTLMATVKRADDLDADLATYLGAGLNVLQNGGADYAASARLASEAGVPWITSGIQAQQLEALNRDHPGLGIGYYMGDEPSRLEMPGVADRADFIKNQYPDALVFANAYPDYAGAAQLYGDNTRPDYSYSEYLDDFINIIRPDVLMYDYYPFPDGAQPTRREAGYFSNLMLVREKAQEAGIPYWGYLQAVEIPGWLRTPSESDMRMHVYSMLAAGYTGLQYFVYVKPNESGLIDHQTGERTALYDFAASVNGEVAHLGRTLRFLESTDVRFVAGQDTAGTMHTTPHGLLPFTAGAGGNTHLIDITVMDHGDGRDGLIGFFTGDDGQQYFMLTNLYHDHDLSAEQATVTFELLFDDTIDEILWLNRLTGEQELITLDNHRLTWMLPGGTGDLFKYNTGDFIIPEPATASLLLAALFAAAVRRRRHVA